MSTEIGSASIKMIGGLIFIIGIIIGLYYLLKRFRIGSFSLNNYPVMRLIGTLSLAPKRAIALVEVCDQWLLVGVGTESVTLISKMDIPEEVEKPVGDSETGEKKFYSLLQKATFGNKNKTGSK